MSGKIKLVCTKSLFNKAMKEIDLGDIDKLSKLALSLPILDIVEVTEAFAHVLALEDYFQKNPSDGLKDTYDIIKSSPRGKLLLCKNVEVHLLKGFDSYDECLSEYKNMVKNISVLNEDKNIIKNR